MVTKPVSGPPAPGPDCPLCPRLVGFRHTQRARFPGWHNAPVESFGPTDARLLIVGLAPGLQGANRTGRPFTGDFAGDLLYPTLTSFGLAKGDYDRRPDDGLRLVRCRITNAVRCVPPANKPVGQEIANCRQFLTAAIGEMSSLRVILALGVVAHNSVVTTLNARRASFKFRHGALHTLPSGPILADSYHCSRYNTNTGRLTETMFHAVFASIRPLIDD